MRKFLLFEDWTILLQGKSVDDQWKSIREMIQETVRTKLQQQMYQAQTIRTKDMVLSQI